MSDDINPLAGRTFPGDPFRRRVAPPTLEHLMADLDRAREALCRRVAAEVKHRLGLTSAPAVSYRRVQNTGCLVLSFAGDPEAFGCGAEVPISLDGHPKHCSIEGICETIKHRLVGQLERLQGDNA